MLIWQKKCGALHIVCSMIVTVNVFAAAVLVRERLRISGGDIVLKLGSLYIPYKVGIQTISMQHYHYYDYVHHKDKD